MAIFDLRRLTERLNALGLIGQKFSGRLTINLNQGGISEIEKQERLTEGEPADKTDETIPREGNNETDLSPR